MKKVAVIILNWNGVDHNLLRHYLTSVVKNTNPDLGEIIVADNGSTDESLEVLQEEFPGVRVIALPENYGFAEGYNRAIAQVEHPYVILLNDDVAVSGHWLEPLVEFMDKHTDVWAAQPKLLSDRDQSKFEYAGASGGFLDRLGYPYCRGRIFQNVEEDFGQYDKPIEVDWATGACLMVRREKYMEAGGLDGHFFAHMEEIDLCWRLRRMGGKVACVPSSEVFHLGGASLGPENPRKTLLNFRNSLIMLYKNLPHEERSGKIFRRKLWDGLAALNFMAHFQFSHAIAIWKAHRQAARMIQEIYRPEEKAASQEAAPSPWISAGRAELQPISILLEYYVLNRHTYVSLSNVYHSS